MSPITQDIAIKRAIVDTLIFFRMFGRPLSRAELFSWLWDKELPAMPAQKQLDEVIDGLVSAHQSIVIEKGGYLYLGSLTEYPDRQQQIQENKLLRAKAMRYLPGLRFVPGIRYCALANTLAFDAADRESDIDLFIITQKGMLWWVRILVTCILHLQGVRRHGRKVAGRFCLSFFIDETAMDLSRIAIADDIYLQYWIATLQPIFGKQTAKLFHAVNEDFVNIPSRERQMPVPTDGGNPFWERHLQGIAKPLLHFVRFMQRSKMKHLPVVLDAGAHVVVNDHMLKFHNNDRRQYYREIWHEERHTLYNVLGLI